ncbi:hypothetical protein FZ041_05440 [Selenomonas caprae]|uniref:Uncharacterized protein n=1 Tax=Selenomonas caprae TaxID=2606905 RepID=A0A5D6WQ56_9FIRM|nr:hypothetical protein [Selenomonas caprae]TYZ29452.1 hypothetical protein FZ041_05440 [Selenomonas caprae]
MSDIDHVFDLVPEAAKFFFELAAEHPKEALALGGTIIATTYAYGHKLGKAEGIAEVYQKEATKQT